MSQCLASPSAAYFRLCTQQKRATKGIQEFLGDSNKTDQIKQQLKGRKGIIKEQFSTRKGTAKNKLH